MRQAAGRFFTVSENGWSSRNFTSGAARQAVDILRLNVVDRRAEGRYTGLILFGSARADDQMTGHECYHCKQWVDEGEKHDCWTTTEAALTEELSEELRDAWARLREAAASLGEQRIYASHNSIMFARETCYCYVRPRRSFLEVCVFLGRTVKAPQVRRVTAASRV